MYRHLLDPKETTFPNIDLEKGTEEKESEIFPDVLLSDVSSNLKPLLKKSPSSSPEFSSFQQSHRHNNQGTSKKKISENSSLTTQNFSSLSSRVFAGMSNRYDFPLEPSKMALLVIDIQEFLSKRTNHNSNQSYLFDVSLPQVLPNIERLVKSTRNSRNGGEVIFTYLEALTDDCRDVSLDYKLSGSTLGTKLPTPSNPAKFLPQLQPDRTTDILIPKTSCSVFISTNIHYVLRNLNVEQVVICGQLTNQCVESAARDAADLGYFVTVVNDACAALSIDDHEKGLYGMKGFSRIINTEEVIAEMQQDSLKTKNMDFSAPIPPPPQSPPPLPYEESLDEQIEASKGISSDEVPTSEEKNLSDPSTVSEKSHADSATEPRTLLASQCQLNIIGVNKYKLPSPSDGAIFALLNTLQLVGVIFLRVTTVDICNSIRCKAVPIKYILSNHDAENQFTKIASLAEACLAGLPSHADSVVPGTGLSASRVLYLQPDLNTMRILPYAPSHAFVMASARDQQTGNVSPYCTRSLLSRIKLMAEQDFGLVFHVGAEIEFQLYSASSDNTNESATVDHSLFANSTTLNEQESFTKELIEQLGKQNIEIELVHSESAGGQLEVVLKYQEDIIKIADNVVLTRETIMACAKKNNMKALFLPKTNSLQAGNGLHLHFSFVDINAADPKRNAFGNVDNLGGISAKGKHFMEGILQHFPALLALTIPTTNSFRRVGPGCWTGHKIGWAVEDKEAALRVCLTPFTNVPCHFEIKLSDSTANIYLELVAILAVGLDGVSRCLDLRLPASTAKNAAEGEKLPHSLSEALANLENDQVLVNALGPEMMKAYCALKRAEISHEENNTLKDDVMFALRKS